MVRVRYTCMAAPLLRRPYAALINSEWPPRWCFITVVRIAYDNARIAENHHRQRQKISVEKYETCRRLLRSEAAVDARWYTDFTDDVRCQTCHQRIRSQDNNPDRGEHDWNIYHALFVPLLQTWHYTDNNNVAYTVSRKSSLLGLIFRITR